MKLFLGALFFCSGVVIAFFLISQQRSQHGLERAVRANTPQAESRAASGARDGASTADVTRASSPRSETANGGESAERQVTSSQLDTNIAVPETGPGALGSESGAPANPVPLLDGIKLRGTAKMLHSILEQEPTDYSWAAPMEADLNDYFASNSGKLGSHFGVPKVVCRQTLCEIQAIGYGEDSKKAWQAATSDMHSQPWARNMVELELRSNPIGPGETGLVLMIDKGDHGTPQATAGGAPSRLRGSGGRPAGTAPPSAVGAASQASGAGPTP